MRRSCVRAWLLTAMASAALCACDGMAPASYPGEALFELHGTVVDVDGAALRLTYQGGPLARLRWYDVTTADRRRIAENGAEVELDNETVFWIEVLGPPYLELSTHFEERQAPDGAVGLLIAVGGDELNESVVGVDRALIVTYNGNGGALDELGYPRGLATLRLGVSGTAVVDSTAEAARVMLDDDGDAVVAQVLENALAGPQSSDGI